MSDTKHLTRKWNSLYDLSEYLEKNGIEKIKNFDGASLLTNKRYYTLYQGELSYEDI